MGNSEDYGTLISSSLGSNPDVTFWRVNTKTRKSLIVGIDDKGIGGPYQCPRRDSSFEAKVYFGLTSGQVCEGVLRRPDLLDLEGSIALLMEGARVDPQAARVLAPQEYPFVETVDSGIRRILAGENTTFVNNILSFYAGITNEIDTQDIEAVLELGEERITLATSEGITASYDRTSFETYIELGGFVVRKRSSLGIPSQEKLERMKGEAVRAYLKNTTRLEVPEDRELDIVLSPQALDQLVETYLQSNFQGEAVALGRSAFKPDQFKGNEEVFGNRVNVVLDGVSDLGFNSAPFDDEGIPGRKTHLVEGGRLSSPVLGVKWGDVLGMDYTGHGSVRLSIAGAIRTIPNMLSRIQEGILVEEFQGLHTQTPTSGVYSLPTRVALVIKNGEIVGGTRIAIEGNFFEDLSSPNTRFAKDPHSAKKLSMRLKKKVNLIKED